MIVRASPTRRAAPAKEAAGVARYSIEQTPPLFIVRRNGEQLAAFRTKVAAKRYADQQATLARAMR